MDKSRKTYRCGKCPYETPRPSKLRRHNVGVHEKIMNCVCEQCGSAFPEEAKLKRHEKAVHLKKSGTMSVTIVGRPSRKEDT